MTEHTPGPWEVVGQHVFTKLGATNAHGSKASDRDGWNIATINPWSCTNQDDEEEDMPVSEVMANAALIAAAPELLEALESCLDALWEDSREVILDGTMMFGHGYDWDGWEHYRWELHTRQGSFAVWPAHGTYSAYGGLDGSYWNQCFANAAEAKLAIVKYVARIDPEHPASKAYAAIAKARSQS